MKQLGNSVGKNISGIPSSTTLITEFLILETIIYLSLRVQSQTIVFINC